MFEKKILFTLSDGSLNPAEFRGIVLVKYHGYLDDIDGNDFGLLFSRSRLGFLNGNMHVWGIFNFSLVRFCTSNAKYLYD